PPKYVEHTGSSSDPPAATRGERISDYFARHRDKRMRAVHLCPSPKPIAIKPCGRRRYSDFRRWVQRLPVVHRPAVARHHECVLSDLPGRIASYRRLPGFLFPVPGRSCLTTLRPEGLQISSLVNYLSGGRGSGMGLLIGC